MTVEQDIERILSLLKRAIRSSGLSQKEVDRRIGVQPGYLSQVMIGRLDLKLKHLFRSLEAIEVDPGGFFSLAFPARNEGEQSGSDVLNLLPSGTPDDVASLGDAELRRLVARALADELGLPLASGENGLTSRDG